MVVKERETFENKSSCRRKTQRQSERHTPGTHREWPELWKAPSDNRVRQHWGLYPWPSPPSSTWTSEDPSCSAATSLSKAPNKNNTLDPQPAPNSLSLSPTRTLDPLYLKNCTVRRKNSDSALFKIDTCRNHTTQLLENFSPVNPHLAFLRSCADCPTSQLSLSPSLLPLFSLARSFFTLFPPHLQSRRSSALEIWLWHIKPFFRLWRRLRRPNLKFVFTADFDLRRLKISQLAHGNLHNASLRKFLQIWVRLLGTISMCICAKAIKRFPRFM